MDALDYALFDAWARVSSRLRQDRRELLRRANRRGSRHFSRPVRPWCLCLRASDSRLRVWAHIPKYAEQIRDDNHQVTYTSETLRQLCKPVTIDWPGLPLKRAADVLGTNHRVLQNWVKRGHLKCNRYPHPNCGKRGRPFVWTPSPIDSNAQNGRPPEHGWGDFWTTLWQRIPDDVEFTVTRTPWTIRGMNRGWMFQCPGLSGETGIDEDGNPAGVVGCGRIVHRLYIPLPVFTIADFLGNDPLDISFPFPKARAQPAPAQPAAADPPAIPTPGPNHFRPACKKCYRIAAEGQGGDIGWNLLISHLSGGLLYGHEVERPAGFQATRRRGRSSVIRRGNFLWERRQEITAALAAGKSIARVADEIGVSGRTLTSFVDRQGIPVPNRRRKSPTRAGRISPPAAIPIPLAASPGRVA